MRRRRITGMLVVPTLLWAVAGCIYNHPAEPLALRASGDTVEILYTSCEPEKITLVEVLVPDQKTYEIKEDAPRVWQVSFDPPVAATSFVVGRAPAGGTEQVRLSAPLDDGTLYAVRVYLGGGGRLLGEFERRDLAGGKVDYDESLLTPEEFEKRSACPR